MQRRGRRDARLDGFGRLDHDPQGGGTGRLAFRREPEELGATLAAAASISEAGLDRADTMLAIVVFVAVGSITVAGSVLL